MLDQQGAGLYYDIVFTHDNPFTEDADCGSLLNVQLAYEKARNQAIAGGYEKLWIVEADMLVPPDALVKLLSVEGAAAVTGVYVFRHRHARLNLFTGTGARRRAMEPRELAHTRDTDIITVKGGSMGCLLIDVAALQGFTFMLGRNVSPDTYLQIYLEQKGYTQKAHLGVLCGHQRPDGTVLWPDRAEGVRVT